MSLAGDFFDAKEINGEMGIDSAAALWTWVQNGAASPVRGKAKPVPSGTHVVYRGQATASYGLSSSLYRLCRDAKGPTVVETDLAKAEAAIIDAMRKEGLGRLMTDGELLMVLQHHAIPTRLIDVSTAATEALFFAVDQNDASDGRLFIIDVHAPTHMQLGDAHALPWAGAARGTTQSTGQWSATVDIVNAASLDSRMRAQRGKFLVGGLNRRQPGRMMWIRRPRNIAAEDYPEITSLGINFLRQRRPLSGRNARWPATGWTVRIEAVWKPDLRERLRNLSESIRPDTMYPPVTEVKRLALVIARQELGQP
jgi:hypothetical protein